MPQRCALLWWIGSPMNGWRDPLYPKVAYELPATYCYLARQGAATVCLQPRNGSYQCSVTGWPNLEMFDVLVDQFEPNLEAICVRNTCILPAKFSARFLESSFTARQAWTSIWAMIRQEDGDTVTACAPVIRLLQFVLTKSNAVHNSSSAKLPKLLPSVRHPLREHRCKMTYRYLPSLDD